MVEARQLLEGAVDTHVHSAPDLVERKLDDFELARQAKARGMAGLVLKNHFFTTTLRAKLVASQVPGIEMVASIVLNQPMGGINPWAVEAAGRGGAKAEEAGRAWRLLRANLQRDGASVQHPDRGRAGGAHP